MAKDDFDSETLAEAEAQLPEDHPVLKALRAERKMREAAERKAKDAEEAGQKASKLGELRSRFPFLTEGHTKFLGPDVGEWEARAEELNELRGNPAPEAGPDEKQATQAVAPHPEEKTFAQAAGLAGRTGDTAVQTYSPSEIRKIGLRDEAAALKLIQEGRMQIPQS